MSQAAIYRCGPVGGILLQVSAPARRAQTPDRLVSHITPASRRTDVKETGWRREGLGAAREASGGGLVLIIRQV